MPRARAPEWGAFRAAAATCLAAAPALLVVDLSGLVEQQTKRAVVDGSFMLFSALAAVACFRLAAQRIPGRRLPWLVLGGAATCYAVGNATWFYYQVLTPETQTFPGPADIFYVLAVPFAIAGMLTLPRRRLSPAAGARAVADGLIMAAALLFISWVLVVGPLLSELRSASAVYVFVYLYYPLTDVVMISVASGMAMRALGRDRLPLLMVSVAFVAIACADTGISYLALEGREAAGSGLELGWTFGYMLLGLATLTPDGERRADDRADPAGLVRELLPYVPVAVVVLVRLSAVRLSDYVLALLIALMVVLIVVRHLLALADNIRLTRSLEDRVRQRTMDLEQLTRRHQSILNGAGEGIVGLDRSGRVTFINRAAAVMLGRSVDEFGGRVFHAVAQRGGAGEQARMAPEPDPDPIIATLTDGQERTVTDMSYRRADGGEMPVEISVSPIRDEDDVTAVVLIFRDVTERRAVDRMKDEFVSVVSHELRTPLTSMRGALGLLEGHLLGGASPKAQQMMRIAVDSTDRLIRLINDILDVERMAAGELTLRRRPWPAADLVARSIAEMQGLAAASRVALEPIGATGVVEADADRIVQTLTNLISNSIKFSPAGSTVRITAEARDTDVLFRVSDEGEGIPPDKLDAVFDRFSQADASDTRRSEGSGLGLAICRGIVEQHGGRIWAENIPGAGAAVSFVLPRLEIPVDTESDLGGDGDGAAPAVLVCDDDAQIRAVVGELLRSHGYRVVEVASGEQALAAAVEQPPAVALMDLSLPDMDGWSTVAALRADARTSDVPVVIVSGVEPGRAPIDVAAWLTKPLDVTALLSTLNDAIGHRHDNPAVLVIEDDPSLAQVLVALLNRHGVTAITARTARETLQLTESVAPDLVLLDLLLPDSDGFQLVDWFRDAPHMHRVPLVVYTALDLSEDDMQRLRLGPTAFYTKTRTTPEEVERHVLRILDSVVSGAGR